jgi:hypothetical protein
MKLFLSASLLLIVAATTTTLVAAFVPQNRLRFAHAHVPTTPSARASSSSSSTSLSVSIGLGPGKPNEDADVAADSAGAETVHEIPEYRLSRRSRLDAVQTHGISNLAAISGRTQKQCRSRWKDVLIPSNNGAILYYNISNNQP